MKRQGKKRRAERLLPVLLLLLAFLGGCGAKGETVAVLSDESLDYKEKIELSEAVFYMRLNQQSWEQVYVPEFGEDFWTQTLNEETGTFADELKRQVMETICQIHLLNAHAEEYQVELTQEEEADVDRRVQEFLESHSDEVKKAAGASEKLVKKLLTGRVLSDKVAQAMVADYEPEVTEEEAELGKMTYCLFSTMGTYDAAGNHQAATAEEMEEIRMEAEAFAQRTAELGDINAAAEEITHTCIDVYFGENTNGGAHELVAEKVRTLEEGQSAGPIRTEEGYYVIQYMSGLDEQATAENREKLLLQKKEARMQEMYQEWLSQAELTVDREVWDSVQVDQVLFAR